MCGSVLCVTMSFCLLFMLIAACLTPEKILYHLASSLLRTQPLLISNNHALTVV